MLAALGVLAVAQLAGNSIESAARPARWEASVQLGGGRTGEDPVAVLVPRAGYAAQGAEASLVLAAPIYFRVADVVPYEGARAEPGWLADWRSAETWVGFVERLSLTAGGLSLAAGALGQETLGHGAVVDRYNGSLDASRPRSGARLDLGRPTLAASVMADSVVRPHLIAAGVHGAPLAWAGVDAEARFRVGVDGAVDLRAPLVGGGRGAVGAGALGVGFVAWRGRAAALQAYAVGAGLARPGSRSMGGHAGLRLEADSEASHALAVKVELVAGGRGWQPGYFDAVYEAERWAADEGRPKSAELPAGGVGARGAVDASVGPASFGLGVVGAPDGSFGTDLSARIHSRVFSLAALWVERGVRQASDLAPFGDRSWLTLEGAVNVEGGLFVFTSLHHGLRRERSGRSEPVTDWLLGAGWAAGDVL